MGSNSLDTYTREFSHLAAGRPTAVSPVAVPRSVPNAVAAEVARDLGARGPSFTVSSACASGATALGVARDLLSANTVDVVLAGGSESARSPMTATCFAQMRALSRRTQSPECASRPFDIERDGFVLGEGVGILVLERAGPARRRGATIRALLRGYAATSDAYSSTAPHPDGISAEQAVLSGLADAGCTLQDIGHISAHGTSTPVGDAAAAQLLRRLYDAATPPVTAIKSVLGHALGAAAAIEAAVTVLSLERQAVPPTANLVEQDPGRDIDIVTGRPRSVPINIAMSTSFGFGGHNAVLIFSTP
ncbi:beta-ketoacyl-[acyl-carrier-protein] synthase family protein [Streptomyces sp. NPDC054887]